MNASLFALVVLVACAGIVLRSVAERKRGSDLADGFEIIEEID